MAIQNKVRKHRLDLLYLIFLTLAAGLSSLYLQQTHSLYAWADWSFHVSRVEEIYQNLKSGHFFTYIATRTFSQTGVGSFLPLLFLLSLGIAALHRFTSQRFLWLVSLDDPDERLPELFQHETLFPKKSSKPDFCLTIHLYSLPNLSGNSVFW